ncbi:MULTISPECIES: TauD/TfdA family dioxygenase [unclassified Kitasatospora]|uniref:TauD/TfdA dioxygenase family protein n=1 Tax=unclassified Kitasatospora TaxID=2633591 RepID=UPI0007109287|nr:MULTISPECIES: TauD/TfdA family dioxygenase [unclassified Kitasatospora]KQV05406.1 taurine dioxygenase [Kitasatospora sp. Root107]KRB62213.1 taurine dioxygenase [Kitasatospora sp. Root187]
MSLEIHKVGGRIGAEITGVDTSRPLDAGTVSRLNEALVAHKALFFREQHLDDEGQLRFAANFGALTTAHPTVPSLAGQPSVLPVDSEDGGRANHWHTDVTFVRTPPKASTLRALVVPPYGGNTLIADSQAAYRDLPEALRELADRLWAVHTNDYDYAQGKELDEADAERRRVFTAVKYRTAHPVVRVHPESGERGLFVGGFAQRILGLPSAESHDLLRSLQAYVTRPENVVRWRWSVGDLVLFDNRSTQHYAPDDYDDLPRRLHRVTVAGDVPVGVSGESSYLIEGDEAPHYTS